MSRINPHYERGRNAFETMVVAVLLKLTTIIKGGVSLPAHRVQQTVFSGPDGWKSETKTLIAWRKVICDAFGKSELSGIPEIKNCALIHQDIDIVGGLGRAWIAPTDTQDELTEQVAGVVLQPLVHLLQGMSDSDLTKDMQQASCSVGELYDLYFAWWFAGDDNFNVTLPLTNFVSDLDATDFGHGTVLRPLTVQEKSTLYNSFSLPEAEVWTLAHLEDFVDSTHLISYNCNMKRDKTHQTVEFLCYPDTLVSALRLCKPGNIGAPTAFLRWKQGARDRAQPIANRMFEVGRAPKRYVLGMADLPGLRKLFEQLISNENATQSLDLAIRRFNMMYTRRAFEDRVVDCTISLESCLLFREKDELCYRLALRGAALLASLRPPADTANLLRAIYELRSKIVHEGASLLNQTKQVNRIIAKTMSNCDYAQFVEACEEITRQVLCQYLHRMSLGPDVADVNQELDRKLVDSLAGTSRDDSTGRS